MIKKIIRQANNSSVESRLAIHYALMQDIEVKSVGIDALKDNQDLLVEKDLLPIGSVEFIREIMSLNGINEPDNLSYPQCMNEFLGRKVESSTVKNIKKNGFIKPQKIKAFTGFVLNESLNSHDLEQFETFKTMDPEEPVWISEPVSWVSEYRYYVFNKNIVGAGRYDDGSDDAPMPDKEVVSRALEACNTSGCLPIAYSIDMGVLGTGETALVECNDAWALGFYKGTLSKEMYLRMLFERWQEISNTKI